MAPSRRCAARWHVRRVCALPRLVGGAVSARREGSSRSTRPYKLASGCCSASGSTSRSSPPPASTTRSTPTRSSGSSVTVSSPTGSGHARVEPRAVVFSAAAFPPSCSPRQAAQKIPHRPEGDLELAQPTNGSDSRATSAPAAAAVAEATEPGRATAAARDEPGLGRWAARERDLRLRRGRPGRGYHCPANAADQRTQAGALALGVVEEHVTTGRPVGSRPRRALGPARLLVDRSQ